MRSEEGMAGHATRDEDSTDNLSLNSTDVATLSRTVCAKLCPCREMFANHQEDAERIEQTRQPRRPALRSLRS